jgi:hypothetical protein
MTIKNTEELREFLSNEMSRLGSGETTPASVNAMANLAGKMLQSVKLEIDYNRIVGATPNIEFLGKIKKIKALEDAGDK